MTALAAAAAAVAGARELPAVDPYLYETWDTRDGLPQSTVFALTQDRRGYLWVGTEEGLARFDGRRFENFDADPGDRLVQALLTDPEGGLWIGTRRGLSRRHGGRLIAHPWPFTPPLTDVRALLLDRRGRLWIGTQGGLVGFDPGDLDPDGVPRGAGGTAGEVLTRQDGLPDPRILALTEDDRGQLWIGTQGGLSRLANGGVTSWTGADGLADPAVLAVQADRRGRLWIGTGAGLQRLVDGRLETLDAWAGVRIQALHEDEMGTLWVGTYQGLWRVDRGTPTAVKGGGLAMASVLSLGGDTEGNVWAGLHYGGLVRLAHRRVFNLGRAEGLSDDFVWTVLEDRSGRLWVGTVEGLTRLDPDGTVTRYGEVEGLPGRRAGALFEDRQGDLWVGTFRHGLLRWQEPGSDGGAGRLHRRGVPESLHSGLIRTLYEDRAGRLWIGTQKGLHLLHDGDLESFELDDRGPWDVQDLHEDAKGRLWIAAHQGLFQLHGGVPRRWRPSNGDDDLAENVRVLHGDADGALWIGTEDGLYRLRGGHLDHFTTADGLYDSLVHQILDDDGHLWLSGNRGIYRLAKAELDAFAEGRAGALRPLVLDQKDGMRSSECNGGIQPAGVRTRNQRLVFPTVAGLAMVDPSRPLDGERPPPIYIEEIITDAGPLDPAAPAELPPDFRSIDFRFSAPSFSAPHLLRFRYRLEGFDPNWSDAVDARTARYTSLDPGHYRFEVIVGNRDGRWSEAGASFGFEVRPHFWETPIFYGLCLLAAALAGRGFRQIRLRRLERRNRELETMRRHLEAKNAAIREQRRELRQFADAVSHDLKSPLFTIQGFLTLLQEDARAGDEDRVRHDVDRIHNATEHMDRLLKELQELARVGQVAHTLQTVRLAEVAAEAVELVAGRISERGVEVRVDPAMPSVRGDRPRLLQLFQNLVDNAVKYIGDTPDPRIEIGGEEILSEEGTPQARCWVRDNGIGIDPAHQEQIFGLFRQLDKKSDGTGLGLALVKRIVELHEGKVRAESEGPGKGTTFVFTLATSASLMNPGPSAGRTATGAGIRREDAANWVLPRRKENARSETTR